MSRNAVRLFRRRINLSFRRWSEIRRRHPRQPQIGTTAGGVRTVAHTIPVCEYGFTVDRLHSVPNRAVIEEIRSRLLLGLEL